MSDDRELLADPENALGVRVGHVVVCDDCGTRHDTYGAWIVHDPCHPGEASAHTAPREDGEAV